MFWRILGEAAGVIGFLAGVFLGVPAVLSLGKPPMPAAKPLFEPLAALQHLDLPLRYDISVTQSGQGIREPRTRFYALKESK